LDFQDFWNSGTPELQGTPWLSSRNSMELLELLELLELEELLELLPVTPELQELRMKLESLPWVHL